MSDDRSSPLQRIFAILDESDKLVHDVPPLEDPTDWTQYTRKLIAMVEEEDQAAGVQGRGPWTRNAAQHDTVINQTTTNSGK